MGFQVGQPVAVCGRPVAACGHKLWPLYKYTAQSLELAGWQDGGWLPWMVGWLDGGGGHHSCDLCLFDAQQIRPPYNLLFVVISNWL